MVHIYVIESENKQQLVKNTLLFIARQCAAKFRTIFYEVCKSKYRGAALCGVLIRCDKSLAGALQADNWVVDFRSMRYQWWQLIILLTNWFSLGD